MKIVFQTMADKDNTWRFGTVYLSDLMQALRTTYGKAVGLHLFGPDPSSGLQGELDALVDGTIEYPVFRRWTLSWAVDRICRRILKLDLMQDLALRRQGVGVIAFGNAPRGSKLPALAWFPDFQSVHMPEMFGEEGCRAREEWLRRIASEATRVILWSRAVQADFQQFLPQFEHKTRVVSPVCCVPSSLGDRDPKQVSDFHHLPARFVYLPNQFWKHKNHVTALRALAILKSRGVNVFLACSGYPGDFRHPRHFSDILQTVSQLGLGHEVVFLGMLPREEVLMLMRQSLCVLNPSLFEGFGMSAEEARAVGKRTLLSDLPSHREQNPPHAIFFDPRNAEDLADKLGQVWREAAPGPDTAMETAAFQDQPIRVRHYAESFMAVVKEVA